MNKIFALIILSPCLLFSCKPTEQVATEAVGKRNVKLNKTYTTSSGLQYMFTALGKGEQAKTGDKVSVHYIGKLIDGKEFDNSYKRNAPISFVLGEGKVIKGWDEGIALLYVGDKAVFTIPAELGYGSTEIPGLIPSNSTLIFEVELVKIISAK